MYSEDSEIYGISIENNERKDVLPPLTRIEFIADSIGYLASNVVTIFSKFIFKIVNFFYFFLRVEQNLLG
jgi:hypothetical protein